MTDYPRLFESIRVGPMLLGNRVLMPAMHMGMGKDGFVTPGFVDFYEERAAAGPGPALMIIGGCYPERRGMGAPNFIALDDDRYVPSLAAFTDRIHAHQTLVAAQLYHAGRYAYSFLTGEQPVSASAIPSRLNREMPRAMSQEEIAGVMENYAGAARRAMEAGFDAVELICAAGYLVNQFLSPVTNKRDDRYGGDLQGRMTFMLEAIAAIKEATADSYPLICRLSGSDFVEGSHTLEENRVVAREMEKAGVDLINVTGGWHETRTPQITMNVPRGAFVYLAEGIREAVAGVPVACCNRINDPGLAEQILEDERADIVAMGRAFIADPHFLRKAWEGKPDDIRRCIACNQACFDNIFKLEPVSCLLNPRVNRERETALEPASLKKDVMVAGGGPAGMEAAWVAARRGHRVRLYERQDELGGQGLLAAVPPGREEWAEMVRYLAHQLAVEGVEVHLETEVSAGLVERVRPDVLVVAIGARQIVPDIEGIESPHVVYAWEVLAGEADTGERVVVIGGGAVGIETATLLAERGKDVVVLEMQDKLGADIGLSSRWVILQDARDVGVRLVTNRRVERITPEGVLADGQGGSREFECDSVVVAVGSMPRDGLSKALGEIEAQEWLEIHSVGDCVEARKATEAIREGFEVALRL